MAGIPKNSIPPKEIQTHAGTLANETAGFFCQEATQALFRKPNKELPLEERNLELFRQLLYMAPEQQTRLLSRFSRDAQPAIREFLSAAGQLGPNRENLLRKISHHNALNQYAIREFRIRELLQ